MSSKRFLVIGLIFALTTTTANANVVGSDSQNFNSVTNGLDFVTVHSSETLRPGIINFGLFLNYAVNTLPYREAGAGQTHTNFNDSLLGMDFNLGLGLMKNWDVGASFPQILSQSVDSDDGSARGQFAENGLTELRLNTKFRFLGDDSGGMAVVGSVNLDQTADNPFTGRDPGPTYNLELAADRMFGEYTLGANAGYRIRSPGTQVAGPLGIIPYENQFIASVAGNYLIKDWDTKAIAEIFGSFPAGSATGAAARQLSSLELLLGLKHDITPNLAAHVGGGSELIHGNASPDWRVYVGLNYTIGPLFSRSPNVAQDPPQDPPAEDPFSGTPTAPIETFVARDILFEFDSDVLEETTKETLDRLADYLRKPPYFKQLDISGHTDSIGSAVYNLDLSQRRARRVKKYLTETHRLPTDRIGAFGYGEGVPIADNGNYQGRATNRRVEFRILRDFKENSADFTDERVESKQNKLIFKTKKRPARR